MSITSQCCTGLQHLIFYSSHESINQSLPIQSTSILKWTIGSKNRQETSKKEHFGCESPQAQELSCMRLPWVQYTLYHTSKLSSNRATLRTRMAAGRMQRLIQLQVCLKHFPNLAFTMGCIFFYSLQTFKMQTFNPMNLQINQNLKNHLKYIMLYKCQMWKITSCFSSC